MVTASNEAPLRVDAGVLQRSLSARRDTQLASTSFATVTCERLQLAVAPPAATPYQPLTLAMLQVLNTCQLRKS